MLLAGCYMAQPCRASIANARWVAGIVLVCARLQSLAGLNPFYFVPKPDGHGYVLKRHAKRRKRDRLLRRASGRSRGATSPRPCSSLQRDQGATLIITDSPETASALSFYLPHNPLVYVEDKPDMITHFDFWTGYTQIGLAQRFGALHQPFDRPESPGRSAITGNRRKISPPSQPVEDPPLARFRQVVGHLELPEFHRLGQPPATEGQPSPMHESDSLTK